MTPRFGFLAWEKREGWKRKRKTEEREEREMEKREEERSWLNRCKNLWAIAHTCNSQKYK